MYAFLLTKLWLVPGKLAGGRQGRLRLCGLLIRQYLLQVVDGQLELRIGG